MLKIRLKRGAWWLSAAWRAAFVQAFWATGSEGWIASRLRESKAVKRGVGRKGCFAVHSSQPALRWPRLPRKFHNLNACRTAFFRTAGSGKVRIVSHEQSPRQRFG